MEEINCIRDWLVQFYARALICCKRKLDELHYDHFVSDFHPWPGKAILPKHQDDGVERLLSFGLPFFYKVNREIGIEAHVEIFVHPDEGVAHGFLKNALDSYYEHECYQGPYLTAIQDSPEGTKFVSNESEPNAA